MRWWRKRGKWTDTSQFMYPPLLLFCFSWLKYFGRLLCWLSHSHHRNCQIFHTTTWGWCRLCCKILSCYTVWTHQIRRTCRYHFRWCWCSGGIVYTPLVSIHSSRIYCNAIHILCWSTAFTVFIAPPPSLQLGHPISFLSDKTSGFHNIIKSEWGGIHFDWELSFKTSFMCIGK